MKEAFGPLFKAISEWNRVDTYVELPWAPRLPAHGTWEFGTHGWARVDALRPDEYLNI